MKPFYLFIGGIGTAELIVMGVIGLLLFGRRLPEVGRSLGKTMLQFKAGLNDMKSEIYDVERLVEEESERPSRPIDPVRAADEAEELEVKKASPDQDDASKT